MQSDTHALLPIAAAVKSLKLSRDKYRFERVFCVANCNIFQLLLSKCYVKLISKFEHYKKQQQR